VNCGSGNVLPSAVLLVGAQLLSTGKWSMFGPRSVTPMKKSPLMYWRPEPKPGRSDTIKPLGCAASSSA
jgi:hypothetical protein